MNLTTYANKLADRARKDPVLAIVGAVLLLAVLAIVNAVAGLPSFIIALAAASVFVFASQISDKHQATIRTVAAVVAIGGVVAWVLSPLMGLIIFIVFLLCFGLGALAVFRALNNETMTC